MHKPFFYYFLVIVELIGYRKMANAVYDRENFNKANVGLARDDRNIIVGLKVGDRFDYNTERKTIPISSAPDHENNMFDTVTRRFNTMFPQRNYMNYQRETDAQNNAYYQRPKNTGVEVKDLLDAVYSKDQNENIPYSVNPSSSIKRANPIYEDNGVKEYNFNTQSQHSGNQGNSRATFLNDVQKNMNRNEGAPYLHQTEEQRYEHSNQFFRNNNAPKREENHDMFRKNIALQKSESAGEEKVIKVILRDSLNIQNLQKKVVSNNELRKSKDLRYPHETYHMKIKIEAEPYGADEGVMPIPRENFEFIDDMNYSEFEDLLDLARIKKEDEKLKVSQQDMVKNILQSELAKKRNNYFSLQVQKPIRRSKTNFLSIDDDFLE